MENAETRLLSRYFRKTKAHPEGSVNHHGDCNFFTDARICTCGLLHDLRPISPELIDRHYPLFYIELTDHDDGLDERKKKRAVKKH